nr:MAG TPA: Membrane-attachment and polymerization-promoting switch [Caudoviricetes sp.]
MRQGIVGITDRIRDFFHLLYHCKDVTGNENERH